MISKKNILGIGITNATKGEVLEYIVKNLENFKKKSFVVTPNPEFLVLANKNMTFKDILNKADLALADGVGIVLAAKIMGRSLKERFTGTDLVKSLCKEVSEKPITVGFLGGRAGVAEATAECLLKSYPKLKVSFVGEEWPNTLFGSVHSLNDASKPSGNTSLIYENRAKFSAAQLMENGSREKMKHSFREEPLHKSSPMIHDSKSMIQQPVDILFVAFGAPKQEYWINENLQNLPVKIVIGVGGAFDYISGKIPRAPSYIRNIGLEWLFRLAVQPWRIKRQLSLLKFIYLVLKERINL